MTVGVLVKVFAVEIVLPPPRRGLGGMALLTFVDYYTTVMQITIDPIESSAGSSCPPGGAG
jgi:hypothetical protein